MLLLNQDLAHRFDPPTEGTLQEDWREHDRERSALLRGPRDLEQGPERMSGGRHSLSKSAR